MRSHRNRVGFSLAGLALGPLLFLAGCAGSAEDRTSRDTNVEGRLLHAPETFTGESTASIDGDGSITLLSDRGTRCGGPYHQVADGNVGEVNAAPSTNGVADLTCSDGRTGSVMFTVGARQAVGTGMLGQDILTLTIDE